MMGDIAVVVSHSYSDQSRWSTAISLTHGFDTLTRRDAPSAIALFGDLTHSAPDLSDVTYPTALREFRDFNCVAHLGFSERSTNRQVFRTRPT
jgi:hypothetical protein